MLRNEEENKSWLDNLSSATGWLNPFNYVRSAGSKVMVTSMVILQTCVQTAEAVCFNNGNYNLRCYTFSLEKSLVQDLIANCSITDIYYSCKRSGLWSSAPSFNFGKSAFGSTLCKLGVKGSALPPSPCVVDVLTSKIIDGTYGTVADKTAVGGIVTGVIAVSVLVGVCFFRRRRMRNDEERKALLEKDLESGLDSPDKTYEKLSASVDALSYMDDERVQALRKDLDTFKDDYSCPVLLKIMSQPVTLGCKHSLEKAAASQLKSCPLCRAEIDENKVQNDSVKKATIANALIDFSERLNELQPKSDHELRVVNVM